MVKRYIKPSWFFARIFNRIALATGAVKSEPLTVTKRRSKLPQTIPMTPVDVDGVKYLVSVRGETDWITPPPRTGAKPIVANFRSN